MTSAAAVVWQKLIPMINDKEALKKAEAYCSAAERCRSEVVAKLSGRDGLGAESIDGIVEHLVKEGFLDESRYAAAFVHDKLRFCKWGRIKIKAALINKGVPRDIIQRTLDDIDSREYNEVLRSVLASKMRGLRFSSDYERSAKLMRFAVQRGFEPSLVAGILELNEL